MSISTQHGQRIEQLDDGRCQLLYDPELLSHPAAGFLQQEIFSHALDYQLVTTGGRGKAWFIELEGLSAVLRAYQRGGLLAKINRQTYFGWGAEQSRAFREWQLLHTLYQLGLPVPQPVAASICRWPGRFSPFYRAHILLRRIADVQTLQQRLAKHPLDKEVWARLGRCIRRFHNLGVYHDDLNASNILLDHEQRVYLIDFDKGEIRTQTEEDVEQAAPWKQQNLQRLRRSLLKQQGIMQASQGAFYFNDNDWQCLLRAYQQQGRP